MVYKVILTSFSLTTNTLSISLSFNTVDENICQGCGAHFDDDDEDDQQAWIGCDKKGCERWYHYWCAGFPNMPASHKKFICTFCKVKK